MKDLWNPEKTSYETNDMLRSSVDCYVMGSNGKIAFTSYFEFDEVIKKDFASIKKFPEAEIPSIHVYVLSKDAATCTYQFKSKFHAASDDTVVDNGCWTFALKKLENRWKVILENDMHTFMNCIIQV